MRVLVTGGTGFVGAAVVSALESDSSFTVRAAVRRYPSTSRMHQSLVTVGELTELTSWAAALEGVDAVVHCAARVHVMKDSAADPLTEFRRVNVGGTLNLARQAAAVGVRRLVFISSVKVHGENTLPGAPYTADDVPHPIEPYAISKYEAEVGLRQLARETGLEVVVIRSALVYGPGVKGNFLSMMRWLEKGIPLPFGKIHNQRSMVALDNLVDLIVTCLDHSAAAGETFMVSDGHDLSTTELLRRTATAMNKPARLIPIPTAVLRTTARLVRQTELAQRLFDSLQVDIRKTTAVLGWTPRVSVDDALRETARDYIRRRGMTP